MCSILSIPIWKKVCDEIKNIFHVAQKKSEGKNTRVSK